MDFTRHVFKCTMEHCFWKILAWNRHSFVLVLRLFITFHSTCLHIALGVPELARWENWNLIIFMKSLPIWNKLYSTCIQMHYNTIDVSIKKFFLHQVRAVVQDWSSGTPGLCSSHSLAQSSLGWGSLRIPQNASLKLSPLPNLDASISDSLLPNLSVND